MIDLVQLDYGAMLALNFDGGVVVDRLMWLVSEKLTWAPLYLFMLWYIWRQWGWRRMVVMLVAVVVGVALSDQICNYFKETYQVLRPNRVEGIKEHLHLVWDPIKGEHCIFGRYGTISAHAATTMSIFLILGLGGVGRAKGYWLWMALWVVLVGYSRIYLGVHFPSQILFGWALGALVGGFVSWVLRRLPQTKKLGY